MRKKRADKDLIFFLVSAIVMVATWVGFEVYRAYTEVKMPEGVEEHLKPLDPNLRPEVLNVLQSRLP